MKRNFKKLFCLLLAVTLLLPVLISIPLTASAGTIFNVIKSSVSAGLGSIGYTGKNYKTGATAQSQTFDLNAGFLLSGSNFKEYWGVCAYSGAKEPSADMNMGDLISLTANGTYIDGLNNTGSGSHGSHYVVNSSSNDSSWGQGRKIGMDFIFRCFYYANQLYDAKKLPTTITPNNCSLQEAIAIAYRYEWDTRLIPYSNTGTWNNSSKTWKVNNVSNWTKSTAHFAGVTDGNATHQAIVTAAEQILVAVMKDADGISGHIQTGTQDGATYLYYPLESGDQCELFCIAGPARGSGQADYQDLFAYYPATFQETTGWISITKVSESDSPLSRVYFGLYGDKACTNMLGRVMTNSNGVATFSDLEPGTYYVKELNNLNAGYAKDETVYTAVVREAAETTISNAINGKFVNYQPTGSWTPNVKKVFEGGTLTNGQFSFELQRVEENEYGTYTVAEELQTVTNRADGSIPFAAVRYGTADIGKTYTYRVREVYGNSYMIAYDSHEILYKVKVTYSGGKLLTVTETHSGGTTFTNSDRSDQYGAVAIKKVDENGKPLAGATFGLYTRTPIANEIEWSYTKIGTVASVTTGSDGIACFYNYGFGAPTEYGLHAGVAYCILEESAPDGYKRDPNAYPVTVIGGKLTYANGGVPVVNQPLSVTWKPEITKELYGGTVEDGQFQFALQDETGKVLQIVSNDANGKVVFDELRFGVGDAGSYTYTVFEVRGADKTIEYDPHVVTFTVYVELTGYGDLVFTTDTDGSTVFQNHVKQSFTPKAKKKYESGTLYGGEFTFQLKEKNTVLQTVTNKADGSIDFDEILYGSSDVGTHVYTVSEVRGGAEDVQYDDHTVTYTVNVTRDGDNALQVNVSVSTENGGSIFTNYVPTGFWQPSVKKELIGREPKQDEFAIELLDEDGKVIGTYWNEYDPKAFFVPAINYTLADVGTHTYTVREKKGTDQTVSYDGHVITYTVNVSYAGTGTALTVTSTAEGDTTFTNYVPTGTFTPSVTKELTGRELRDGEFLFVLEKNGEVLQTVPNQANGGIPFEAIDYTLADVGTHTYTIREQKGEDPSVVYDGHTVTFTVNVSYSGTGTALTVEVSTDGAETFVNDVPRAVWKPSVTKTLVGRELQDGEFTFVLEKDGTELQRVTNKADGTIPFAELTFGAADIGKTYVYTVRELPGDDPTVAYDGHTVTFTVRLTYGQEETQDGEVRNVLQAIAFYGANEPDPADPSKDADGFHNEVSTPPPVAGDKGAVMYILLCIAMVIAVIGIVVFFTRDGKKKKF